jgi:hypothetical protein
MYELRVFHPGSLMPADSVRLARASDVLTTIPRLLGRHAGCERIEVLAHGDRLFAVDCQGQPIAA